MGTELDEMTGVWPKAETFTPPPGRPYFLLATDRHRCGQPVLAVAERKDHDGYYEHREKETRFSRFRRFATREEGERWQYENRAALNLREYRYTVATIP